MNVQPFLIGDGWQEVLDGNDSARDIFERHYSARESLARRKARATKLIVGPGFKLLLLSTAADALCCWRKEKHRKDGQVGVECSVFRREGGDVASGQLRAAMALAWARWPGQRLFSFVDPREVEPTWRSGRPTWGHCFYLAGWRFEGLTKKRLHILAAYPDEVA